MRKFSLRKTGLAVAMLALAIAPTVRADDAVKMLQPDTDIIVTFKMKDLLDKPLIKKYALDHLKKAIEGSGDAQDSFKSLGIDPMKDLDMATIGLGMKDPTKPTVTVVIDGKFVPAKLAESATKEKLKSSMVDGKTIYEIPGKNGSDTMYSGILGSKQVVIGSNKDAVISSLSGKGAGPAKSLAELSAKADPKAVLAIVATKDLIAKLPIPATDKTTKDLIDTIENFKIEISVDKDVGFAISIGAADTAGADKIHEFLSPQMDQVKNQAQVMANFVPPELRPLLGIAKTLSLDKKDKSAVITATLKEEIIEKVAPKP